MQKIRFIIQVIIGLFIKLAYNLRILKPHYGIYRANARKEKVIVSLTSYGRRVNCSVHYTLLSLLRQSYKPDVIVLWLDDEHWNMENLPQPVLKLMQFGVTIKFCNDIKSYKKLIPSLKEFPNDVIITCDDDMYYNRYFVQELMKSHLENPDCVITYGGRSPILKNAVLASYNMWPSADINKSKQTVFPIGFEGCLYKKVFFHKDIVNHELFMKLAPLADDIWFFMMELLNGTSAVLCVKRGSDYPVDAIYQLTHPGNSLFSENCNKNKNDVQLHAVMEHYSITPEQMVCLYNVNSDIRL